MLKNLIGDELYKEIVLSVPMHDLTEVRLRLNKPIAIKNKQERKILKTHATQQMLDGLMARATKFSLYAYQEEIAKGYIQCKGGIRLGVAGKGVVESDRLITYKDITSINIRIPHEILGCAEPLTNILESFENTLIVAPPFGGKTTLIRDMARILSARYDVAIIDEREEIAGDSYKMGNLCDIISGVPKSLAYEGVIRAMSPEIIILDELFPQRDLVTVENINRSGVKLIASIHGDNLNMIAKTHKDLISHFTYGVVLSYKPTVGSIKSTVRFKID